MGFRLRTVLVEDLAYALVQEVSCSQVEVYISKTT